MMVVVQFGFIQPRKPDPRKMLPAGLALVATGYVAADLSQPYWSVCLAFLIVGAGAALAVPSANALGTMSVQREEQASAAALLAAAPPSGFIFGPLIGAGLYQLSPKLPLLVSAALIAGLALYAAVFLTRQSRP
jgi:MFS family permease